MIEKQDVCNEHLNGLFFTIASNGEISEINILLGKFDDV